MKTVNKLESLRDADLDLLNLHKFLHCVALLLGKRPCVLRHITHACHMQTHAESSSLSSEICQSLGRGSSRPTIDLSAAGQTLGGNA